jgi:hypothetical protein
LGDIIIVNAADQLRESTEHNLSHFVHELNVFRRQVMLYPPAHPKTLAGANKILIELNKLNHHSQNISFGIAPDNLMFNGTFLDADNPSCRDLGSFFSRLDIAVITFHQGLSTTELIEFWQLLSTRITGKLSTALDLALKDHQIFHISITVTDYSAFTDEAAGPEPVPVETDIWSDFIRNLIPMNRRDTVSATGNHPADQLAQMLNQSAADDDTCTDLTSQLVHRLLEQCRGSVDGIGSQLYEFSKKLHPEIRQRFHEDTLHALEKRPHEAREIISSLPADFISAALLSHSNTEQQLSSRLTDLLRTFAVSTPGDDQRRTIQSERTRTTEEIQSQIELLLLEDHHNEYLPGNYQQALQKILAGQIQGNLPEAIARQYRNNLAEQMIEHQCCEIIFDLLEADTDIEMQDILQNNLIDLSRFFLDTGDFETLHKTLSRWTSFINSGRSKINLLTEKFFSSQLQPSFITDVLNSVPVWHNEKYAEISDYLVEVGEPYVAPLIERLGEEKDKALRKTWLTLLLEFKNTAHPAILDALEDGRWYLVRNLLVIMRQQKVVIPPKTLMRLCQHPHPEVRCEALGIMFRVNPSTANRLLIKELEGENPQTLRILIPLTAMSHHDKVFTRLNKLLEAEPLTEDNLEIKLNILAGLAIAPQPDCLLSIMRLVSRKEFFVNRLRKHLKSAASDTLRAYPRKQVISLLHHVEEKQRAIIQDILFFQPSSATGQSS